jgi:hypothetical protein
MYGFLYCYRTTSIVDGRCSNGVAKVSVDLKGSAQTLSDELSLKDFGTFTVEVAGSTANSLELKVMPK